MKNIIQIFRHFAAVILFLSVAVQAGNTGKISGTVIGPDGEALIGINVIVEGTTLGAATDINGYYVINNIPPGTYTVIASGIGYEKKKFLNIKVSADFTTKLNIEMLDEAVEIDEIVVEAEAPMVRKDLTSSHTSIDAGQIEELPVESINQILTLQAGITQGSGGDLHIRGGRSNEIRYVVNGVSISNPFSNSRTVSIATNAIQELSVVSGTFNAEYGNALSGIVNTITKEGSAKYTGSLRAYTGDYLSANEDIFFNIDDVNPIANRTFEGTFSGPVPGIGDYVTFFVSGRYNYDDGYLYGERVHLPSDSVWVNPVDAEDKLVAASGDNQIVPMNWGEGLSATGKLTFKPFTTVKINYDAVFSTGKYEAYNHELKLNPEANYFRTEWGMLNTLSVSHALSNSTFYTLKGSYNINDYKRYLYKLIDKTGQDRDFSAGMNLSEFEPSPLHQPAHKDVKAAGYTFASGGTQDGHYYQKSQTYSGKFDITSQVNNNNEVKVGMELNVHVMDYESFSVLRDTNRYFQPTIPDVNTSAHDRYTKKPWEFSAYVQDKMEFESLILNAGIRFDMFMANSRYSTNIFYPTPNDPNLPLTIDKSTLLEDAEAKYQFSPRLGVSFPITDKGIIHFSYGHFFQMPPFSYLYTNPNFEASYAVGTPVFGNANLNPERTVTYELGLQQQLMDNLAFNLTVYYKDVRDLLALQEIRVSSHQTYLKYVNKDYGNIKGVTFSLNKRKNKGDLFGASLDYTFQVAEGNEVGADNFFLDLSSGRQSEKIPVFLDWDQTHTLNASVSTGVVNDWNVALIARLGTGLPYTPQLTDKIVYLKANSDRKPSSVSVDLMAEKDFALGDMFFTIFLKVFNLFDTLNERYVYNDTGRAFYTLQKDYGAAKYADELAERIPVLRTSTEYLQRPQYYSAPREVRLGIAIDF